MKMKKLMMAVAIVCAAAFANAGSVNWGCEYGVNAIGEPGDTGALYSGTVYLVSGDAATFYVAAATDYAAAIVNATVLGSATLTDTAFSDPSVGTIDGDGRIVLEGIEGSTTAFMTAIDDDGNVYISESYTALIPTVGGENFDYLSVASYEGKTYALGGGYQGAGWYRAGDVPEPTSGVLLLIGMAGLALKRKRA